MLKGNNIEKIGFTHVCSQCGNYEYIEMVARRVRITEQIAYKMRIIGRVAEFMALIIELARKFFRSKQNNQKLKIVLIDKK